MALGLVDRGKTAFEQKKPAARQIETALAQRLGDARLRAVLNPELPYRYDDAASRKVVVSEPLK